MIQGVFTGSVGVELRSRLLYFELELAACAISSALEVQVLQEVGSTRALERLMASASSDKHAHGSY